MIKLNNQKYIKKIDRANMAFFISDLPNQLEMAYRLSQKIKLPQSYKNIDNIVICGMGGSAISGDLIKNLLPDQIKKPVSVIRDYHLPDYVSSKTLVIVISYSGNTEETLNCFQGAIKQKAKIFIITSGGKLLNQAQNKKLPYFLIKYQSQPRAALGYLFTPLLKIFYAINLLNQKEINLKSAINTLRILNKKYGLANPIKNNPAKQIAQKIHNQNVLIIGAETLQGVARRWKTQINENAKNLAFNEILPELSHNLTEGLQFPKSNPKNWRIIILNSPNYHPQIKERIKILQQIFKKNKIKFEIIQAQGKDIWSQKFFLILLGDWVSFYLAILNNIDPTPVKTIQWSKLQKMR